MGLDGLSSFVRQMEVAFDMETACYWRKGLGEGLLATCHSPLANKPLRKPLFLLFSAVKKLVGQGEYYLCAL